jgi:hypothetical protein
LLQGRRIHGRDYREPVRLNTNRHYLARAAQLGFRDVYLFGPETPAQCDDGRRQYLWAVLDAQSALRPADNPIRIDSSVAAAPAATIPLPSSSSQRNIMPRTTTTDASSGAASQDSPRQPAAAVPAAAQEVAASSNPIAQAEALRASLRDTLSKTSELISSLKRQRRQSKLVQSTLAALQELRTAG